MSCGGAEGNDDACVLHESSVACPSFALMQPFVWLRGVAI